MDASPFRCGENYPFQLCNNATNRVLILHGGVPRKAVVPAYSRRQHERFMRLKQENVWGGVRERRGGGGGCGSGNAEKQRHVDEENRGCGGRHSPAPSPHAARHALSLCFGRWMGSRLKPRNGACHESPVRLLGREGAGAAEEVVAISQKNCPPCPDSWTIAQHHWSTVPCTSPPSFEHCSLLLLWAPSAVHEHMPSRVRPGRWTL